MGLRGLAHDRQAKPGTGQLAGMVGPVEALEHMRQVGFLEAVAERMAQVEGEPARLDPGGPSGVLGACGTPARLALVREAAANRRIV